MFRFIKIAIISLLLVPAAWADHGRHHGHHHHHDDHHWHMHRHGGYPYVRREIVYMQPPVVEYVPVRPRYYAPPPPVRYYYSYPSAQGLVGSIVGGAVGYEIGRGDPLAAGIGAAAGAYIGNGRY